MDIEFDSKKSAANTEERGISFALAADFDMDSALVVIDDRQDYGEVRYQALGYIHSRLYMLVFTERNNCIRVISLRKANKREVSAYEKATQS